MKCHYFIESDEIENTGVHQVTVYRTDDGADSDDALPVVRYLDESELKRYCKNGGRLVYKDGKFSGYKEVNKKVGDKGMIDVTTFEKEGSKTPIIVAGAICGVLAVCGAVVALAVRKRYGY